MASKKPAAKQAPATKPEAKKTSSEVAIRKEHALVAAGIDIASDAGAGFENTDKDSFAIPFLRVLQSGSPQVKKSSPDYIKGAEEGDFYNTVTKEVFPGAEGIDFIPVHYDRKFVEWRPKRGGFAGEHLPSAPILQRAQIKEIEGDDGNSRKALVLPSGNLLSDTRYHFGLHVRGDGTFTPVLICMASSGIKASKRLMTELNSIKIPRPDGTGRFTPPMFYNKVHIGHIAESNDQGDWFNYSHELNGFLDISDVEEAELYLAAKKFRDQITNGEVRVSHDEDDLGDTSVEVGGGDNGKF